MHPWSSNPAWHNFSSLFREAYLAAKAPHEVGVYHHLAASLYFGISSLEATLNQFMRAQLQEGGMNEEGIYDKLRKEGFSQKFKKWPSQITDGKYNLDSEAKDLILLFNDVRGNITHPKSHGLDIYTRLESVKPQQVVDVVVKVIIELNSSMGKIFPYWLFGWNYINPRKDSYEAILINNQQFLHSLSSFGFDVPAFEADKAEVWKENYMFTYNNYLDLKNRLYELHYCEPVSKRFPYKPLLCKLWWDPQHVWYCGSERIKEFNK